MSKTKVAVLGCGFISEIHVTSYQRFVPDAEVVAVYSHNLDKAKAYAEKMGVPAYYDDVDKLLAECECDIVDICLPNFLHHGVCVKAAKAGKHVIVEKPLCLSIQEADEMIAACKENGKLLMYAEELCFAPKYERVRAIVESGAVGALYMLKQAEKHSGPHSRWFYESDKSGGGVMMDMGCHAIAWFMWMLKGATPKSVYGNFMKVYHDTDAEDHSVTQVEFDYKGKTVLGIGEEGRLLLRPVPGQLLSDVQPRGLRLRQREGRRYHRLDLPHLRGGLQSGLSSGTGPLCGLRPQRQKARVRRRIRQGRHGDHPCRLRLRQGGPQGRSALRFHRRKACG